MKIAVWLEGNYTDPQIGGGFSYYNKLIEGINNYTFSDGLEVCFVSQVEQDKSLFHKEVIHLPHRFHYSILEKIIIKTHKNDNALKNRIIKREYNKENDINYKLLRDNNVQIIYYPIQMQFHLDNYPFIATNWDIGHRSTYAFPEVTHLVFRERDNYCMNILPKALMVFCESISGKKELAKYTLINDDRIRVVPIFAGNVGNIIVDDTTTLNIIKEYQLTKHHYFFYPAQFWAHKNHYNLLRAFKLFYIIHPDYKLVLTGGDQGNKAYIEQCIKILQLSDAVEILGFVNDEVLKVLYQNATSLIMPTLMGPTNMPPLEAMELGCPVICSDLPGHREELGDAAIFIDALKPEEILNAMQEMHISRSVYVEKILQQQKKSAFTIENALNRINHYFEEIAHIRNCWN